MFAPYLFVIPVARHSTASLLRHAGLSRKEPVHRVFCRNRETAPSCGPFLATSLTCAFVIRRRLMNVTASD